MATSGNPILAGLRDLGTSVRTILQDEASRRQAALAAQSQENEQRRALEVLRLSGEQQLARLGIEEAKTRFDIRRGEASEQRAQAKESREAQLFAPQLETARLAPKQAEAGIKLTEAQANKATADIEIDRMKATDLSRLHAAQVKLVEEQRLGLSTERAARAALPTVSMATVEEALTASPNLSTPRKAFLLHFMESMRQQNQLSHTTPIRLDVGLSALDALNKYADILEGGDPKLVRDAASTVVGEMAKSGVFMTGAEAAAAVMDFTRIMQDPAYRQQIQQTSQETKKIYDRLVREAKKDPAKITQKEREQFEQQANLEYDRILQQRAAPATTAAPPPAAARPQLPALSGVQTPVVPPEPIVASSPRVVQVLEQALGRRFVGRRIPDGPHVVVVPGLEPGRTERFAVRVAHGRIVAIEPVAPPKAR